MTKEKRNGSLIATIKSNLPQVGYVKIKTGSDGRKATCQWRGLGFMVSSKLTVKEIGINDKHLEDTDDSRLLQSRLREAAA